MREQLADFVLAALGPVVGVERERERRRVTQPPGERHALPRQRLAALGLVGEVKLHGEAAEQPGPQRRPALGQRGERLLQQPDDRRVGGALLDPTPAEAERRAAEVLPEARRPRELRGGLEGGAAVVELARLAVGLAEAEQQLAAGRLVGGLRRAPGPRGRARNGRRPPRRPARPAPAGPRGPSSRRPWPPLRARRPRRSGTRARRAAARRRRRAAARGSRRSGGAAPTRRGPLSDA